MSDSNFSRTSERSATGPLRTMQLLRERSVEAVLGRSGLNHPALAAEVRRRFGSTDVSQGALVREPVIEGAAPFKVDGRTFADCAGNLLHPEVIRAISSDKAGDYRFPPEAQPYRHQIEAWKHLTAPERQSVLVSSGTGSGKTECFLMPLLHDLAKEAETAGRLSGVRALALYPLNALIASQEERLRAWTAPFGGKVRFGLYNGLTPERIRAQDRPGPEQVADRVTLRSDPPPILVTNVTMLEYTLVRRIDRPLVENSQGKLRWIILDEAHGYVGSAAAEIALLLRRVLLTFGVKAEDVRFVATSATIGGEGVDVTDELRHFLRDISGTSERKIHVVLGEREEVMLPPASSSAILGSAELSDRDCLAASPAVQAFVRATERGPVTLPHAEDLLRPTAQPIEQVIAAVASDADSQRGPLLPLRVHGFLRAIPGLWSCLNPDCAESPEGWAFGAISAERIDCCPCCSAPVFEIMTCGECGEPYLDCEEEGARLQARYTPPIVDEFAALREKEGRDDDADATEEADVNDVLYDKERLAIAVRPLSGCRDAHIDVLTGARHDRPDDTTRPVPVHSPDSCGACDAGASERMPEVLRSFRFGAPYLIGNAAPVMLEGVEPRKVDTKQAFRPPAEGRQLLSFTDSRQGSARFAANLQATSERSFVRGYIYHAVQGSSVATDGNDPAVQALSDEIAQLEAAGVTALAGLIANKKAELAAKLQPSIGGISWPDLRDGLAAQPEVHHWMTRVWGSRDDRFLKDHKAFAEFLLLREFNRRPRRGNTVETMGLARLRFDTIDKVRDLPDVLSSKGKTLEDWQGLLYGIVDMSIRGRAAIRADWNDMHWLHTGKPLSTLLPPNEKSEARRELTWPFVGSIVGQASNLALILEKGLGLDLADPADRRDMNEVLEAAWRALQPILSSRTQPGYALDYRVAKIAPVINAWLCPVTGKVLPVLALGHSFYGHREHLRTADLSPRELEFPSLPISFPDRDQVDDLRHWLSQDPKIEKLREAGVWINLHDRIAMLSPYARAAEHSAQQPASRLRRFEAEFKRGEINILNCSTTMEMGVDIGSVSAVMMTNVPPALANYRQRVGRAGRRRQGFASSLTYTRDTPLDRETFRDPVFYLSRQTRAPKVRLDSRRIVQRHVNALLLARWFATAGGEALKSRTGEFFGCPEVSGIERPATSAARTCLSWMTAPSTAGELGEEVARLVAGTVLAGNQTLFAEAAAALEAAEAAVVSEWQQLQTQIAEADKDVGKASLEYQLKRLARENLLKELVVRGFLPGHGLPTAVVPFVHEDKPVNDMGEPEGDEGSQRRRSYPSRTLDIAIRDYAPGAEVVVNGLVYKSAGVTLNWQRPADDSQVREVQALRIFWTCPSCGASDCGSSAPDNCPSCREEVPFEARRRFLQPAGFVVDMGEKPHADTDDVRYVSPEPEQIVARNSSWQPLLTDAIGRMRHSPDGLVFYFSRGPGKSDYHICLECGRAEPAEGSTGSKKKPLDGHKPLRGTRRNADGLCPGNDKSFKVTQPIALGYEAITDVAEIQPIGLEVEGAAWAAIAALREALCRRIGIETGELGMAVRSARGALGQKTYSLYLYDKASGGAGFAPQAIRHFTDLLQEVVRILDCEAPGCRNGCSACVMTADLFDRQQTIDRQAALSWARSTLAALGHVAEDDRAAPEARYRLSLADDLVEAVEDGAKTLTVWAGADTDVAALTEGLFAMTARQVQAKGGRLKLVVDAKWLEDLDAAAKLALRDAAKVLSLDLRKGSPTTLANGAKLLAHADTPQPKFWVSREAASADIGWAWGKAAVRIFATNNPLSAAVDLDSLLPASGTKYIELSSQLDGDLGNFGSRFATLFAPQIRALAGKGPLIEMSYNDRYLQSPMTVRLLTDALKGLAQALDAEANLPVHISTKPLKENERQPFAPDHDWQHAPDRDDILLNLLEEAGFEPSMSDRNAHHGRVLDLKFEGGSDVRVVLDQGFGPWRAPDFARFNFGLSVTDQTRKLSQLNVILHARGPGYAVITK